MASTVTWRYGVMDAIKRAHEASRDDSPYNPRSWDEWCRDHDKVVSEAHTAGYGPIIEAVIAAHPCGRERDMFVSVLAGHLRTRSWG